MGRGGERRTVALCALLLAGCYALPERHAVSTDPVADGAAGDAGSETDGDLADGGGGGGGHDGGSRDAANGCDCPDLERPICVGATNSCVACTEDAGVCAANQLCDVLHGDCVECLQNTDCKDPGASVCDLTSHTCRKCTEGSANDCSHIDGKNVCLEGTCVQCTKDALAACAVQQSSSKTVQNACHALTHTCTEHELRKTPPCGECVSDAQCMAGHVCVQMSFNGQPLARKWYCQPVREALNCTQRPYVSLATNKMSIDGATQDVCTLAVTTCGALEQYRNRFCGLDASDRPIALDDAGLPTQPSVKGANALCGLADVDDGYCVEEQPGQHRCTLPCGSDTRDCPIDAPACSATPHASGMRLLCTFP